MRLVSGCTDLIGLPLTALNPFAGNTCSAKRSANWDVDAARRNHR
jgi:hypothetical protein